MNSGNGTTPPVPRIDETAVGRYFVDSAGHVWRLVSYAAQPTCTFEAVDGPEPGERRGGVVGSPLIREMGLRLLVPLEPDRAT